MEIYPPRPALLRARIGAHVRIPLYRNAYALIVNTGATGVLGMLYWLLAARLYSPEEVGTGAALISAMLLFSGATQFSLTGVLVRFLPRAASHSLVFGSYAASMGAGIVVTSAVLLLGRHWVPPVLRLPGWAGVWFAAAVAIWSLFVLQDSVLTGLRQAVWIPVENIVFGIAKILALAVFAKMELPWGVFLSWTVPVALSVLPVNWLIFSRLLPRHLAAGRAAFERFGRGQLWRFIAGDYIGSLFWQTGSTGLPLLVGSLLGNEANAYFAVPWAVVTAVDLVTTNLAVSLTVEAAADRSRFQEYARAMSRRGLGLIILGVALVIAFATPVLRIFGHQYAANGTTALRLLAIATLPKAVTILYLAACRVQRTTGRIARVEAAHCLLVLASAIVLGRHLGLTGVAAGVLMG
ncbi:MAG: lipopolysaccharide biosynthesis protein [Egibacteraceae bacterium]